MEILLPTTYLRHKQVRPGKPRCRVWILFAVAGVERQNPAVRDSGFAGNDVAARSALLDHL